VEDPHAEVVSTGQHLCSTPLDRIFSLEIAGKEGKIHYLIVVDNDMYHSKCHATDKRPRSKRVWAVG
jgi:hypothetical protein